MACAQLDVSPSLNDPGLCLKVPRLGGPGIQSPPVCSALASNPPGLPGMDAASRSKVNIGSSACHGVDMRWKMAPQLDTPCARALPSVYSVPPPETQPPSIPRPKLQPPPIPQPPPTPPPNIAVNACSTDDWAVGTPNSAASVSSSTATTASYHRGQGGKQNCDEDGSQARSIPTEVSVKKLKQQQQLEKLKVRTKNKKRGIVEEATLVVKQQVLGPPPGWTPENFLILEVGEEVCILYVDGEWIWGRKAGGTLGWVMGNVLTKTSDTLVTF